MYLREARAHSWIHGTAEHPLQHDEDHQATIFSSLWHCSRYCDAQYIHLLLITCYQYDQGDVNNNLHFLTQLVATSEPTISSWYTLDHQRAAKNASRDTSNVMNGNRSVAIASDPIWLVLDTPTTGAFAFKTKLSSLLGNDASHQLKRHPPLGNPSTSVPVPPLSSVAHWPTTLRQRQSNSFWSTSVKLRESARQQGVGSTPYQQFMLHHLQTLRSRSSCPQPRSKSTLGAWATPPTLRKLGPNSARP